MDFQNGEILLIDKPLTWTSFDVVNKIRYATKTKKVGHAGTLDPLATGLLIVCTGKLTKQIDGIQATEKEYEVELVLGKTTPSIDLESDFDSETDFSHLQNEQIVAIFENFKGIIQQIPPMFSAIKVNGKPAYLAAREGKDLELKSREVEIKSLIINHIDLPTVKFTVVCSKGTYIRSLVRDIGEKLGVGAYMSALRRTRIGDFDLKNAWQLPQLIETIHQLKNQENND